MVSVCITHIYHFLYDNLRRRVTQRSKKGRTNKNGEQSIQFTQDFIAKISANSIELKSQLFTDSEIYMVMENTSS